MRVATGIAGLVIVWLITPEILIAQAQDASKPKFEVVAIKPCKGGSVRSQDPSPGTLRIKCDTVRDLIEEAYVTFADGHFTPWTGWVVGIEGGPTWISSVTYQIDAKTERAVGTPLMRGPMLQTLLEERFHLRIRRERRGANVLLLTVAKGGPKLEPWKEGSCTPIDFFSAAPSPLAVGQRYCGPRRAEKKGRSLKMEFRGVDFDEFSKGFLNRFDRPVVDNTGITGRFDFDLWFSADPPPGTQLADDPEDPGAPSIFTALEEQLGLKLEPGKGTREYLVVDSVERPSEN
jgi:uncharacterized protein (TIGR03435 family)